jgi:hypothetical protein
LLTLAPPVLAIVALTIASLVIFLPFAYLAWYCRSQKIFSALILTACAFDAWLGFKMLEFIAPPPDYFDGLMFLYGVAFQALIGVVTVLLGHLITYVNYLRGKAALDQFHLLGFLCAFIAALFIYPNVFLMLEAIGRAQDK